VAQLLLLLLLLEVGLVLQLPQLLLPQQHQ
jgi:hypothetical protein